MKKVINIPGAPAPIGPYSPALMKGGRLYISGQLPVDSMTGEMIEADIAGLTRRVMENIGALLHQAGMNYSHIVKTSIFLADMNDFAEVNKAYAAFFESDFPARETIQVARLPKDARVEISAIAEL